VRVASWRSSEDCPSDEPAARSIADLDERTRCAIPLNVLA
jgi:hypothetical protein